MTARSRACADAVRLNLHLHATSVATELAGPAVLAVTGPYSLMPESLRSQINDSAYRAAFTAAYEGAVREQMGLSSARHTVIEHAASAADRTVAAWSWQTYGGHRFGRVRALELAAGLLPARHRGRWTREWLGELATLPDRRQRARYAWRTLCGLPRLAWTLWSFER